MKYFLFAPRFVEPIERRTKRQTIRKAARCEPGEVVSLRRWTGRPYGSKQTEIVPPVRVEAVLPVRIAVDRLENQAVIVVGTEVLEHDELCRFVRADGFNCVSDFIDHWSKRPAIFEGFLHTWEVGRG